jgi:ribonucleoside-diphosphate reductase beta chain
MLNWDDPLASHKAGNTEAEPIRPHNNETNPRPGDGLQDNDVLMATAGAAPSVNPDPITTSTPRAAPPAWKP